MAATAKTVKDVQSHEFVKAYAAHLKRTGKIELPPWHDLVKTAAYKEMCPFDADWYYVRAASIARHIYLRGGVGVGGFKKRFGGKSNRGVRPGHYCKASGSVQRHVMQQLEALKILEKHPNGGRRITSDGQRDLDRIAGRIEDRKEPSPIALIQPADPAPAEAEETAA